MSAYRNDKGQFVSKYDYERTYGKLPELTDPEIQASIRDMARDVRERHPFPYKQIHNFYYGVWIVTSAVAIMVAFFLGTVAYR